MTYPARPSARLWLAALLAVFALGPPLSAHADELEEVLEGFEDEEPDEPPAGPAEDGESDDILGGFDDDDFEGYEAEAGEGFAEKSRFWELTGSASLGGSVNYLKHESDTGTDYGGLARLRTRLNLQLDLNLPFEWKGRLAGFGFYDWAYLANGRNNYTDDVLDTYEWEVDFQEVWLQGSLLDDLDLKMGRQIVNWGRSDTLRVLDVLNPLDNREPGLVDIEDLRRPVAMLKADYYLGDWALSGMAIPEMRFDLIPQTGSDFAPTFLSLGAFGLLDAPTDKPSESVDNTEWAAALSGIFSGWDVSFHFARVYWNEGHLDSSIEIVDTPFGPLPDPDSLAGTRVRYSRVTLVGAGANYTIGSWLFKAEIAWLDGLDYARTTPVDFSPIAGQEIPGLGTIPEGIGIVDVPVDTVEKSRLDFMGGIEYYGFTDTNIALEVVNRHIFGFDERMRPMFVEENSLESSLRITRTFLRERLEVTALGVVFGNHAQDGSVVRLEAKYDLRDALEVGGGILLFQEGDLLFFQEIGRNDRFFFEIKYSF